MKKMEKRFGVGKAMRRQLLAGGAISQATGMCRPGRLRTTFLVLLVLLASGTIAVAQTPITVMTYNNKHGSTSTIVNSQLDTIAAQNPDVVVVQEGYSTQVDTYANGLNARMNTTAWHGSFTKHCKSGTEPTCTTYATEGVMVLTRLKTTAVTPRLIWAKDDYFAARATLRMGVALADGSEVNVSACHLPALIAWRASRMTYVNTITTWAGRSSWAGISTRSRARHRS
jgi:endonuclease/exonuclease/phosphatase family metal-dependent hydrolase